jgi:RNA polymerase sigma factor (sigma-70 family)
MHLKIDRMTDNELIRGIRENSPAAWRELYKDNYEKIKAKIAPMLVRTKDVTFDDLFDDAMLTLMDNVKDGKVVEGEATNLSGYLYTICWRMALRLETKNKRAEEKQAKQATEEKVGIMQEPIEEEDTSIEPEEYAEAMAFFDRVFESIPPRCKSILKRFYWDKPPMSEIAAIHGLRNENSAKTTKNRCMDKFKAIAKAMLADDAKVEEAVRRTVERDALRDLLEEIRKEEVGEWARAALEDNNKGK